MRLQLYLTLGSLCTGTLVAVFLRYYIPLVNRLAHAGARLCSKRIQAARTMPRGRHRLIAVGDAVAAVGLYASAFALLIPLVLIVIPLLFTLHAFVLAAQIISIG